jgi:hypothetical protein
MLCKGYQACSQVCAEELVEDCGIADSRTRDDGLKFALNDAASRLQQVKVKSKAAVVTVLISGTPEPFPGDEAAQKVLEAQRAALQRTGFVMVCPAGAQRRTILDTGFWASFQRLPEGADTKGLAFHSTERPQGALASEESGQRGNYPLASNPVCGSPPQSKLPTALSIGLCRGIISLHCACRNAWLQVCLAGHGGNV